MVARDEELSSASLLLLKIHVVVVRFKAPEGQTGTECLWEEEREDVWEESAAQDGELN